MLPIGPISRRLLNQSTHSRVANSTGMLHISLAGKKLRGEWTIRRDAYKGGNAWMLEKIGKPLKAIPAKKEDQSALTGRSMEEIAAAKDATWQSNRAAAPIPGETKKATSEVANKLSSLPEAKAAF